MSWPLRVKVPGAQRTLVDAQLAGMAEHVDPGGPETVGAGVVEVAVEELHEGPSWLRALLAPIAVNRGSSRRTASAGAARGCPVQVEPL